MSFRRINFFRGLFMTAEDWKTEQNYHIEKRRLHARVYHTPGVVRGEEADLKESLNVTVTDNGTLVVQPGYAVDGNGRELSLPEGKELPPPSGTGAEKDMFIYITFDEERTEPRESRLNPDYRDNAIICERAKVAWSDEEPDNDAKIELARIKWRPGHRITREHIDTSHIRYAGTRHAGAQAVRVQAGEADLNPNPPSAGLVFAADDVKILIQSFTRPQEAENAAYFANVYPSLDQEAGDARIFWRIESSVAGTHPEKKIVYSLLLKNFGTRRVRVRYLIYRLNARQ